MQRKFEIGLIYLTGLLQGLVLVIVPAASSVFTDPHSFGFSSSQYGALFIPQVILSILAALLAPRFAAQFGSKIVYQVGVFFNLAAAALIGSSQLFMGHPVSYILLMLGTSAVGAAFGTTLPMINVYAARFFPQNPAGALTGLHSLLGTGTALAPLLVILFVQHIGWWVLPLLALCLMAGILIGTWCVPLEARQDAQTKKSNTVNLGQAFWLFILIIFLYGFCETLFGNWAIIYLSHDKALPVTDASLSLSVFWVMVTVGRLLTSFLSAWVNPRLIYRGLPVLIILALGSVTLVHSGLMGMMAFGLAGLACSSFFPLSFSFAQGLYPEIAEQVSGSLMASYMLGYGFASYGIGRILEGGGIQLALVYQYSCCIAVIILVLAFILTPIKNLSFPRKRESIKGI